MTIYHNDVELFILVLENNVHINNSFKINSKKDMYSIIRKIKEKYPTNNINKTSDFMLVQEWATHNLCYNLKLFRDRTKDVDLDYTKKWYYKIAYAIIGFLYI